MVFHRQPVSLAVFTGEDQAVRTAAMRFPIAVEKRDFFLRCLSGESNGIDLAQRQRTGGAQAGADDNFPAVKYNAAADGGNEFRSDKAEAHNPEDQKKSKRNRCGGMRQIVQRKAEHNQTGKQSKEDVRNGTPAAQGKSHDRSPFSDSVQR